MAAHACPVFPQIRLKLQDQSIFPMIAVCCVAARRIDGDQAVPGAASKNRRFSKFETKQRLVDKA
jgi:hypothetical protein